MSGFRVLKGIEADILACGRIDYNPELLGTGTAVIDANTEIWRFFSRFRR